MQQTPRSQDPPPALVAALIVLAIGAFFPGAIVWLTDIYLPITRPDVAADRIQSASYWLIFGLLAAEYLILRSRAKAAR